MPQDIAAALISVTSDDREGSSVIPRSVREANECGRHG